MFDAAAGAPPRPSAAVPGARSTSSPAPVSATTTVGGSGGGNTSRATAYNAITHALESRQADSVDHLRRLEFDRLDALHASLWPQAMTGHVPSVLALLRVIDLRTRLMGLAPAGGDGKRKPDDAWPSCHGPATVVINPDDCRHAACERHGSFVELRPT